jgi:hypothetical protein
MHESKGNIKILDIIYRYIAIINDIDIDSLLRLEVGAEVPRANRWIIARL